jgi:hypothetical protein
VPMVSVAYTQFRYFSISREVGEIAIGSTPLDPQIRETQIRKLRGLIERSDPGSRPIPALTNLRQN